MRVGSQRNHAGNGYGQQVERRKTNWRDASDIHSFFFTRFPEEMNESDLWYEFKKWGDVREVFIARNRNRWGKRYGFVRFKGVKDQAFAFQDIHGSGNQLPNSVIDYHKTILKISF